MKTQRNYYLLFKISILTYFLLQALSGIAQTATSTTLANSCYAINGLYAGSLYSGGDANQILGNTAKENQLLQFIRDNGFNYLLCYETQSILPNSGLTTKFAAFIKKARTQYGLQQVAAVIGTTSQADLVVSYNDKHTADERIDVLNLEDEFWNASDHDAALNDDVNTLNYFASVGHPKNIEVEVYVGNFDNQAQATKLANAVDRILVHFYRDTDVDIIDYNSGRLVMIGNAGKKVKIAPIFSSEGSTNYVDQPFLGDWLFTHPQEQAFKSWITGYNALTGTWKNNVEVMGASWFIYDLFIQSFPNHITSQPVSQTACAGQTKTFSVTSSATNKVYYWVRNGVCLTDGANIAGSKTATLTISNITIADTGSYFCRVVSYDAANPGTFASDQAKLTIACVSQSPYGGTPWPIPGVIQAENYDLGGQDIAYNDLTATNLGGAYRNDAVDIETCTDGANAFDVGYIEAGEWLEYTVNVQATTKYSIDIRVAAIAAGEKIHIEIDGINVTGALTIPNTTGWDTWQTVTIENISLMAGKRIMRVVMETGDFNLNFVEFKKSITTNFADIIQNYIGNVFPNPAYHELNITDESVSQYRLVSLTGITVQQGMIPDTKSVNIESLASGSYILELTGEAKQYHIHIIKQ